METNIYQSLITEIKQKIVAKFNPTQIILLGSMATETADENSDIDLLVVQDTISPKYRRSAEIRKALIGLRFPIDILVYTPQEFENEQKDKYSFLTQALKTSRLIYEQS
jgi:predicted nucleotidyltransferase